MAARAFTLAAAVASLLAIALNVFAQWATVSTSPFTDPADVVISLACGCTFAVCGLQTARLGAKAPAAIMIAGAFLWPLGALAEILHPVSIWWAPLYAISGALGPLVILLVILYPSGTIVGRPARLVLALTIVYLAVRTSIRLFAENGDWCLCAPNPLLALPPSVARDWYEIELFWGALLGTFAVIALVARWVRGSHPWRASNLVMTVLALAWALLAIGTSTADLTSLADEWVGWTYARIALTTAVPVAWVVGLSAFRQARARVADVVLAAQDGVRPQEWDRLVRSALDDRSARVLWRDDLGLYRDADGRLSTPSAPAVPVGSSQPPPAVIEYDPALSFQPALLESLSASIAMIIDNERLATELTQSILLTRESRARIVDAADDARRRIERDLHDGAQQVLMAASISVDRARERLKPDSDPILARELSQAAGELVRARRELRELARGITPSILDHGGLAGALEELALRSPVPATVAVSDVERLDEVVTKTVYFLVAEALTNVAVHAGAHQIIVTVDGTEPLRVVVEDDGSGGAHIAPASGGLRGLSDRVEALGGSVRVEDREAGGTIVRAVIPSRQPTRESAAR